MNDEPERTICETCGDAVLFLHMQTYGFFWVPTEGKNRRLEDHAVYAYCKCGRKQIEGEK